MVTGSLVHAPMLVFVELYVPETGVSVYRLTGTCTGVTYGYISVLLSARQLSD